MLSLINIKKCLMSRVVMWITAVVFSFSSTGITQAFAAPLPYLPAPNQMIASSDRFVPVMLKGIKFDAANPFKLEFIVDEGNTKMTTRQLEEESKVLVRYFLSALTVPAQDLWVNLSPYEQTRIIPQELGLTDLGRDMLGQDYVLKQLASSLTYPESPLGKQYWDKVYKNAQQAYGTSKVPVNTFNKIWIVPDKTQVHESGTKVFITTSTLKVMTESDYLAASNQSTSTNAQDKLSAQVLKDLIIPQIEKDVNSGKNFAYLRQMHSAIVLAGWFKNRLQQSIYEQLYIDKNKVNGIKNDDPQAKDKIFNQYVEAFKQGAYNYVGKDVDAVSRVTIKRQYYSGGLDLVSAQAPTVVAVDDATLTRDVEDGTEGAATTVTVQLDQAGIDTQAPTVRAVEVAKFSGGKSGMGNGPAQRSLTKEQQSGKTARRLTPWAALVSIVLSACGVKTTNLKPVEPIAPLAQQTIVVARPEPRGAVIFETLRTTVTESINSVSTTKITLPGGKVVEPIVLSTTPMIGGSMDEGLRQRIASGNATAAELTAFAKAKSKEIAIANEFIQAIKAQILKSGLTAILVEQGNWDKSKRDSAEATFGLVFAKLQEGGMEVAEATNAALVIAAMTVGDVKYVVPLVAKLRDVASSGKVKNPVPVTVLTLPKGGAQELSPANKATLDSARAKIEAGRKVLEANRATNEMNKKTAIANRANLNERLNKLRQSAAGPLAGDINLESTSSNGIVVKVTIPDKDRNKVVAFVDAMLKGDDAAARAAMVGVSESTRRYLSGLLADKIKFDKEEADNDKKEKDHAADVARLEESVADLERQVAAATGAQGGMTLMEGAAQAISKSPTDKYMILTPAEVKPVTVAPVTGAQSSHLDKVKSDWVKTGWSPLTENQLAAIWKAHNMPGGIKASAQPDKDGFYAATDTTGTVGQNAAKIRAMMASGLDKVQAEYIAAKGFAGVKEDDKENPEEADMNLPVGGISEEALKIETTGDGTQIPMFKNVPVDTNNFTGFSFQITSIGRNKTANQIVFANLR